MITISDFIKVLNPIYTIGNYNDYVASLCYDSRKCGRNSLFVAISGNNFDGHDYIEDAIKRGAKYIVCERIPPTTSPNCMYLVVKCSRRALAQASHFWFRYPTKDMSIIGVTGTNGKTTITYLLEHIAHSTGIESAIIGTTGAFAQGYEKELSNTTPESYELVKIFNDLKKIGVKLVAMEVSSHSLDQERVYGISFKGGIFTNLTQDHLDYHRDMINYANAKKRLFDSLLPDSIAVVFSDDPYGKYILQDSCSAYKFAVGRNRNSDVRIVEESLSINGSNFTIEFNNKDLGEGKVSFESNLIGRFNIDNAVLAITMGLALGFELDIIRNALKSFKGVPGRMEKVILENGALGIVDYSHTPDALQKALETCREAISNNNPISSKLICVFGCGGDRDKEKRPLMGKIAEKFSDLVVITSDNPRTEDPDKIINQIYKGISKSGKKKVIQISNRDEAIEYAYRMSNRGDIILVAGKGHEQYQIIGNTKYHFSDKEQLEKYAKGDK
jgi:UDP-N-acetylmuramyl-tripeptide synthetase